jgi:hypothetical protein
MATHHADLPMRLPARIALFAALAAALGFLFSPIPNIELMTFTLFAAGYALGFAGGAAASLLAVLLYFGMNPYGSSFIFPPLLLAQLFAAVFIASLGSTFARLIPPSKLRAKPGRIFLFPFAAMAALALPIFPSFAFAWTGGGSWEGWLMLGILMTSWGFVFNIVVFTAAFPPLVRQMERIDARSGR